MSSTASPLAFRDPALARRLLDALAEEVAACGPDGIRLMHVCGSHEQAIARLGLRSSLPAGLDLRMGPGCPVCVTDVGEIDAAVHLALAGVHVATYGDMLEVPGTTLSLAAARTQGATVSVVYSIVDAVTLARDSARPVVFFATGFETTAVATAAAVLAGVPESFSILSAHKYVPAAMRAVARLPQRRIAGLLAAGHAATITGSDIFKPLASEHHLPIVVAGFEPLDIVGGLLRLVRQARAGEAGVTNLFPRCVRPEGNRRALRALWRVFAQADGIWRGLARVPDGDLRLRPEWQHVDATCVHAKLLDAQRPALPNPAAQVCRCGDIMIGLARPNDCSAFGNACQPSTPLGACMVSSEGACRIWHQFGADVAEALA